MPSYLEQLVIDSSAESRSTGVLGSNACCHLSEQPSERDVGVTRTYW